jgi:hypothetical protein
MNIAESSASTSQGRLDDDLSQLRELFQSVFVEGEEKLAASLHVRSAFRLGQRPDDASKLPRPIKVVLTNVSEARIILQRTYRLAGSKIRVLRDLSPECRVKLKTALGELRERRAQGENDLVIRDFRVVRLRPRVRWQPLILLEKPLPVENPAVQSQTA